MNFIKKVDGFTLTELLIVISVIAILSTIVLVALDPMGKVSFT